MFDLQTYIYERISLQLSSPEVGPYARIVPSFQGASMRQRSFLCQKLECATLSILPSSPIKDSIFKLFFMQSIAELNSLLKNYNYLLLARLIESVHETPTFGFR